MADAVCACGNIAPEATRIHVTPVLAEIKRIMDDIRATGKCGMFVARWDGQAWCFHKIGRAHV